MYICYSGHEEVVYEYYCPVCDLIEKMEQCPNCKTNKDIKLTDTQKEIERLKLKLFNEETLNGILQRENEELKKKAQVIIET